MTNPSQSPRRAVIKRVILISVAVIGSFVCLSAGIVALARTGTVTPQVGLLMFVALIGFYVGFGILIGVHHLVSRL